jgi:hypothetical protein
MDSNIQRSVRSLALLSVLAGTIALTTGRVAISGGASGQQSPNSRAQQIQGAWVLHVSAHDCQTGPPEATFQSIVTFAQGGTLTNVTTGGSPALRTTGLGTWERAGAHEFTAATMVFLFSPAGAWRRHRDSRIRLKSRVTRTSSPEPPRPISSTRTEI